MTTVKIHLPAESIRYLNELKTYTGKSKRILMREAIDDYIDKHKSDLNPKQEKLKL